MGTSQELLIRDGEQPLLVLEEGPGAVGAGEGVVLQAEVDHLLRSAINADVRVWFLQPAPRHAKNWIRAWSAGVLPINLPLFRAGRGGLLQPLHVNRKQVKPVGRNSVSL